MQADVYSTCDIIIGQATAGNSEISMNSLQALSQ